MTAAERRNRFLHVFDALTPALQADVIAFMGLPDAERQARMNEIRALSEARGDHHQIGTT
jgi:hypothetical protein